jgi:hypothetical protein
MTISGGIKSAFDAPVFSRQQRRCPSPLSRRPTGSRRVEHRIYVPEPSSGDYFETGVNHKSSVGGVGGT